MTIYSKILKVASVVVLAASVTACGTTGLASGAGHYNKDVVEMQGRVLNNEAQVIQNVGNRNSVVFNNVLAQGQLAEAAGQDFDPTLAWAIAAQRIDGAIAKISTPMLNEINRRLAKHNKKTVWVFN